MGKLLVFAGTSEGRKLVESISKDVEVVCCVATEYGKSLLPKERDGLIILQGRMTINDMSSLMAKENFDLVIDTTHPYAQIVTENIKKSAEATNTKYIRFLRDSAQKDSLEDSCIWVDSVEEAVNYLNGTSDKVLFTIGSKELHKFTEVIDYRERIIARVLPMAEVVTECNKLGFDGKHLICMQGPFSVDMNKALIKQTGAKILVTKDSGSAGGFMEKIEAVESCGIKALVIGRPTDETGYTYEEVLAILKAQFGHKVICEIDETDEVLEHVNLLENEESLRDWFPMFLNIKDANILVVGGGNIAKRRVVTLRKFSSNIAIVAPIISDELKSLGNMPNIAVVEKNFEAEDLDEADIVIAATDRYDLNEKIGNIAREKNILANIASKKEICDFYFPGVVTKGNVTVGITAQGTDHKLAKEVTDKIKSVLED